MRRMTGRERRQRSTGRERRQRSTGTHNGNWAEREKTWRERQDEKKPRLLENQRPKGNRRTAEEVVAAAAVVTCLRSIERNVHRLTPFSPE